MSDEPRTWRALLPTRHLVAATLCGLGLRLFVLYLISFGFAGGDARSYDELATNLLDLGVFGEGEGPAVVPQVLRAPGYPFFVAAVYSFAGLRAYAAVQGAQILLSLATHLGLSVATAKITNALALPSRLPLATLWACMLSPFDAAYCGALLSETLCTALLVGGLAIVVAVRDPWRWITAGFAFGAAALVRDVFLLLVPCALLAWALLAPAPRKWRAMGRDFAMLLAGLALALAPWIARNHRVTGHFIAVSQGSLGSSLWMGAWATDGQFTAGDAVGHREYPDQAFLTPDERPLAEEALASPDGVHRHRVFMDLFYRRFRHEPLRVVGRWIVRIPRLWLSTRFDVFTFRPAVLARGTLAWTLAKVALFALDALLVGAGLVGLGLAARRRIAPLLFLSTPIVYLTALFLPLHSFESRYSQPALPILTVLGCFAVLTALEHLARRRGRLRTDLLESKSPP